MTSKYCEGEQCFCGAPATHKVEETIFDDDPSPGRHPLTSYLCDQHFNRIMGPAAKWPNENPGSRPGLCQCVKA